MPETSSIELNASPLSTRMCSRHSRETSQIVWHENLRFMRGPKSRATFHTWRAFSGFGAAAIRTLGLLAMLVCTSPVFAETYRLPLFVGNTTAGQTGVLRISNESDRSGTASILAIDDSGVRYGPASLTLAANATVEFDASDLESGNSGNGPAGGLGALPSSVRLEILTDLPVLALAFLRTPEGTLAVLHDEVQARPVDGGYEYRLAIFNQAHNLAQASSLRLINPSGGEAHIEIQGHDDSGAAAQAGSVTLRLAAGDARTLTAQQLEAGDAGLTGMLGAGSGRWTLLVSSDQLLDVVNLVTSSTGRLDNLSSTGERGRAPADHSVFGERFTGEVLIIRSGTTWSMFAILPGGLFTESVEPGGGSYAYRRTGREFGELALSYDQGDSCVANLHFASRTGGWHATRCAGTGDAQGTWSAGSWAVADESEPPTTPPTPPPTGGVGPSFSDSSAPGDLSFVSGTVITPLQLPAATGGSGTLTYSLAPDVPGLSFDADERQISGTPTTVGVSSMTYTVTDNNGRSDSLTFLIVVRETASSECLLAMLVRPGESCVYPGTSDAFTVNADGSAQFLVISSTRAINIPNRTFRGRIYDFRASHQGEGVWRIDRLAGEQATEPPMTKTPPSLDTATAPGDQSYRVGEPITALVLPTASGGSGALSYSLAPDVPGLSFDATTRRLSGTPTTAGTHAMVYTATGEDGDTDSLTFTITVEGDVSNDQGVRVVRDHGDVRRVEVTPPGRVHVSVVDPSFEPESHGQRVTDVFTNNTNCASLGQLWGSREFEVNEVGVEGINTSGILRHTLTDDSGIFFTASDSSPLYREGHRRFFLLDGRPFLREAREVAEWIGNHNVLLVTSLENATAELTGNGFESNPLYCDDFDPQDFIPLCGALDDYIAHSGVGIDKTIFVGAIDHNGRASGAIRADGVFADHSIYVESPNGSTSQATPVLAAYATNLLYANPSWSASDLRTELMRIASEEVVKYLTGRANSSGQAITETRTVKVIRPAAAPACPLAETD